MDEQVEKLYYMPRPSRSWGSVRWWGWYDGYLHSDIWRQKSRAVLRRASGTCECCTMAPATEAHHVTYVRVGREKLKDLLAVCGPCHERLHARKATRQGRYAYMQRERSIRRPLRGGVRRAFSSIRHRSCGS